MALYRLGYPNREVRQSLNGVLLRQLVQDVKQQTANSKRLARLLEAHDCAGLKEAVPHILREHPVPVVHEQPDRELRGLLRERVLLLLRGVGGTTIAVEESSNHGRLTWQYAPAGTCICSSSR